MNIAAQDLPTLSLLLDEGWDLSVVERQQWLATLPPEHERFKQTLEEMLSRQTGIETDVFVKPINAVAADLFSGRASVSAPAWREGSDVGGYSLIREIGVGGMGVVWLAAPSDGVLKRQVALKLPLFAIHNKSLAERFDRERDILASLTHPNIARLYDAGTTPNGQPFLALEYVEGSSIKQHCVEQKLTIPARLRLLMQVLAAVQYAHSNLVLHRDLKPSNVLVTSDGQVKLLDFGIAKLIGGDDMATEESALTQVGGQVLTPDYASPEQIRGEAISTASDVYSLGVVAYEMLTETKPYQLKYKHSTDLGQGVATASVKLASATVADPKVRQQLKGDIDAILNKALKKDIAKRYLTVGAFAEDIERHLAHLPVQAQPDALGYRVKKFLKRNMLPVGAGAAIAISLSAGAGVATWKAVEARQERVRAERVKDLIGSIFASANPYSAGRAEVSVRDLLKAGVDRVERELSDDPVAAAELLSLLSGSYRDLGEVDLAFTTARKANELAGKSLPQDGLLRARILRVFAHANKAKGNIAESQRLIEQAIDIQRRWGDEALVDLAQSVGLLARVVQDQGRVEDAIQLSRETVGLWTKARGSSDPMTISASGELSNALMIGQYHKEALVEAQRSYELAARTFTNPDHPIIIDQTGNLAYALRANGQHLGAREKWQAVVNAQRKTFNPRGQQVAASLVGLGQAQEFLGELKPALQSFEESLSIMNGFGDKVSGELAIRHFSIGRIALQSRQADKAARVFETAIEFGTAVYGTRGGRVRDAENFRVASLIYGGRLAEAQSTIEQHIHSDRLTGNPALRMALRNSALLDWARGDTKGTLEKMREVEKIESKVKGVPAKSRAQTQSELGRAQLDAVAWDRAVVDSADLNLAAETLAKAVAMYEEAFATSTPEQADAWVALGRARLRQNRVEDALVLLKRAAEFWAAFDDTNSFAGEAAYWYGAALKINGEANLARTQWARARDRLSVSRWPSHRKLGLEAK